MWTLIENTKKASYWYDGEVVNVGHGASQPKASGGYTNLTAIATTLGDSLRTPDLILNLRNHIERYMIMGCTFDHACDSTFKVHGEPCEYIKDQLKKATNGSSNLTESVK